MTSKATNGVLDVRDQVFSRLRNKNARAQTVVEMDQWAVIPGKETKGWETGSKKVASCKR